MVFAYARCSYCGYYNEICSVYEIVKCKMCDRMCKVDIGERGSPMTPP